MKKLIFTFAIILSFTGVNAQQTITNTIEDFQASKISFYKALIAKNNFDIDINDKLVKINTKSAYYKALMIKNGFITTKNKRKSIRLAKNTTAKEKSIITSPIAANNLDTLTYHRF